MFIAFRSSDYKETSFPCFRVLFTVVLFFSFCMSIPAQAADTKKELALLRQSVETEVMHLKNLRKKREEVHLYVDRYQTLVGTLKEQEKELQRELSNTRGREKVVSNRLQEQGQTLQKLQKIAMSRIRSFYFGRGANSLSLLSDSGSILRFERYTFFLSRIRKEDKKLSDALRVAFHQEEKKKEELLRLKSRHEELLTRMKKKGKEIQKEYLRLSELEKSLNVREKELIASLSRLKGRARELDGIISRLTGGEPGSLGKEVLKLNQKKEKVIVFTGEGLSAKKQSLVTPVQGKVKKKFGKQKVREFEELVFHKGVEFEAKPEAPVRAIGTAKVIFVGNMPGFGRVVILDHGKRYYSLYGRLGETLVKESELVSSSQTIARLPEKNEKLSSLYFEIRKSGKPENPARYMKALS